jgi:uncharacterized protein (DUF433 family)
MDSEPVIQGRRIKPCMVLNMLAKGSTRNDVLNAHTELERENIVMH